jgi:predicted membrane metal-binding protein
MGKLGQIQIELSVTQFLRGFRIQIRKHIQQLLEMEIGSPADDLVLGLVGHLQQDPADAAEAFDLGYVLAVKMTQDLHMQCNMQGGRKGSV